MQIKKHYFLSAVLMFGAIFYFSANKEVKAGENIPSEAQKVIIAAMPKCVLADVQTDEAKPDLIISNIRVIPKNEDPYLRNQIGVTIKNNSNIQASILNTDISLIYGTNFEDINNCAVGSCRGAGNKYKADIYASAFGKHTLSPSETYEIIFNKQNYLLSDIEFEYGVKYLIKAVIDDNKVIGESDENNNFLTKEYIENNLADLKISNIDISDISKNAVRVRWKSNVPCNGAIRYVKSGSVLATAEYEIAGMLSKIDHDINLTGLDSGTTYYYEIKISNGDESNTYTHFFQTAATDEIFNVQIINITHSSAVINWTSGEEGNTAVAYALSQFPDINFNGDVKVVSPPQEGDMTINHSFILNNLLPDTTYYFRVRSTNLFSGNKPFSEIYNFTTKAVKNNQENRLPDIVNKNDAQLDKITINANRLISNNKMDEILAELKQLRDTVKEQQTQIKYLTSLKRDVKNLTAKVESALNNFITYGVDDNTQKLGAGERAAVIASYKSAFNKLPETEAELADAIKIANGRWPSLTNQAAENKAKAQFKKIYKKDADMNNAHDNAAVTVMAYGLRQKAENRNLNSEKAGIKIFKGIYGKTPSTTDEWNIMQAITYSGASR